MTGGGGWNANGYQSYGGGGGGGGGGGAGTGGGPMRNNYSGQSRSAPYGGGK